MANIVYRISQYFSGVVQDLTRQKVLLIWGALLLGIYLTGWWRGDFEKVGLAVAVTFFLTAPRARGLVVSLGLLALLAAYANHRLTPELRWINEGAAAFKSDAARAMRGIGK